MRNLFLKPSNALQSHVEFRIVCNHVYSSAISMMPCRSDLPLGNSLLLASERCRTARPEHACSKMCQRRRMVEKNSGFTGQSSHIECILHQKEYVHVSRLPLSGNKRPEHHEPSQLARANRNAIDSFKALPRRKPLPRSLVEAKKRLPQSATVNSSRKITIFSERWQRSFCRLRHKPLLTQAPHHG